MATVRFDITGGANERSVTLEVDESKEVSSYKIDASNGTAQVFYKKRVETEAKALTGVIMPVEPGTVHAELSVETEADIPEDVKQDNGPEPKPVIKPKK